MIVYFLRGLCGAGKSALASELEDLYSDFGYLEDDRRGGVVRCEADDFFMTERGYVFDHTKLSEAHAYCMDKYKAAIRDKVDTIIVSNVSAEEKYVKAYQALAEDSGYTFISLIVERRHEGTNAHGVPDESIERMKRKFHVQL